MCSVIEVMRDIGSRTCRVAGRSPGDHMGTITSGIGLASGIDSAGIIEQLLAIEGRGRLRFEQQITDLRTQQTAFLDINARLGNLQTASAAFRLQSIFNSAFATTSNADILGATASTNAQPGSYAFRVSRLVSTSQHISQGFASRDATPLGLSDLSFEFGQGGVLVDRPLEDLNGGQGVERGSIIVTDRESQTATIDLTDATSVGDVLDRINSAAGVDVRASIVGDRFVIEDLSGGTKDLVVEDAAGVSTATDLGIVGLVNDDILQGSDTIYRLGGGTPLSSLNDGTGVYINDGSPDLQITLNAGGGSEVDFLIDLGRIDEDIDNDTLLADLNNGDGIPIDDDSDTFELQFIDRTGTEHDVDLTGVTTVGGLAARVNSATSGAISLSVEDGEKIKVTDETASTDNNLRVLGTEDAGDDVAEALGILNETGVDASEFDGEVIPNVIDLPRATTMQEVIDRINNAVDELGADNAGRLTAEIAADGRSLEITDTTGGPLTIASTGSNLFAARDLGIETAAVLGGNHEGTRLIGGLDSVLLSSLAGGAGFDPGGALMVTDRAGNPSTGDPLTFDPEASVGEVIADINAQLVTDGVLARVGVSPSGNGLALFDESGGTGNLVATGTIAENLGFLTDPTGIAADRSIGTNLQRRYVAEGSLLSDLNYGRGVGTGRFRITDGLGGTAEVTIGGTETSLTDVINEINSRGLKLNARVNDNGDGLIIEEQLDPGDGTPFRAISVESISGTTAADLGILGESEDIEGGFIDGSYERVVDVTASDSLDDVVQKINDASIPVAATVVNTGSGSTPFRLSLTSSISGAAGEVLFDTSGIDIGMDRVVKGADAAVFFGGDADGNGGFLVSSNSNTLDDVIDGLTINLLKADDEQVQVDVARDDAAIVESVANWVTSFNDVIDRLAQYDFFDVETEERGALLGDPTVARIRSSLYRTLNQPAQGIDTSFSFLAQVGIRVGGEGRLEFNEEVFRDAFTQDPGAVEQLFAAYDVETTSTEEIAPGVTVQETGLEFARLGVAELFEQLLDDLTDPIDGPLDRTNDTFDRQIESIEQRIEDLDERLERRRLSLQREFANLELTISGLQEQSSALASLQNLSLANTNAQ